MNNRYLLEKFLIDSLKSIGVNVTPEYRFHPIRRWRFDFADPALMIAVEIEGGTWVGGRHITGSGYAKDCEKYNTATALGWRVFRFTPQMLTKDLNSCVNTLLPLLPH